MINKCASFCRVSFFTNTAQVLVLEKLLYGEKQCGPSLMPRREYENSILKFCAMHTLLRLLCHLFSAHIRKHQLKRCFLILFLFYLFILSTYESTNPLCAALRAAQLKNDPNQHEVFNRVRTG